MIIGVPKEIKTKEFRVGVVPSGVEELVHDGHTLLIEAGAGLGSGIPDENYVSAGAKIVQTADDPEDLFLHLLQRIVAAATSDQHEQDRHHQPFDVCAH